ncbi:RHS repeat-associated core domain-containing protein [Streptomyces sp. HD]|uniref:RHS repeat-associated core domain-containing protein n=1 Tax=Streptomyces sp. HD TaxID=3020892 RepID=UPI00232C3B45|nr:RHS repeat-associated core domain-containing protein [Streptomyces sp. HD]MDC0765485.1 DUF6531 domain-containing protein [Streptomyces sp. HD]
MGYVLPSWLDEILDFIGINWPNVDEDDYREMADAMRELADAFDDHAGEAVGAVNRLLSSSEGWAVDALQEHWDKVKSSHLEQLPEVARLFADAMDVVADVIYGMKIKAEVELGAMAASVGISIGLAFVTGGLSALIGAAEITAMREVVRRLIKEAADQIVDQVMAMVTEPVAAKLEKMIEDVVLDLASSAISPAHGAGGGGGGGHGKGSTGMQLNSAGGSAGGGPSGGGGAGGGGGGGGGAGRMRIDHAEYDRAAGDLGRMSESSLTRLSGSLDRAHNANNRTRGKDPFTQGIDAVVDGATKGMKKAVHRIVKHTGETIPKNLRNTSENHKRNEKANEDALKKIMGERDGKDGPSSPGDRLGGPGGKRPVAKGNKSDRLADPELARRARENSDKTKEGDPIDMATGEMLQSQVDLALPGVLPLIIERTHLSNYRDGRFFGPSWTSTLDERLERVDGTGELWWHGADGSSKRYSHAPDLVGESVLPREGHRIPLTCVQGTSGWDLAIIDPRTGLTRRFLPTDGTTASEDDTTIWWLADIEDRNGNSISFHRDEDGTPSGVVHSAGYHVVIDSSDHLGRVSRIALHDGTAETGETTVVTYGYDAAGNLAEIFNSSEEPMRFGYDSDHRITSWTDRNDSTFRYEYDSLGRVVRTVGPDGCLSSTLVYDDEGRRTRYTDSTGATRTFFLNHLGQVIAETDPLGNTTHTGWDRHDNVVARTDALGHTTQYERDEWGNVTAITHPDGTQTLISHDPRLHRPVETVQPDGTAWCFTYDSRGNLTSQQGPDGTTTHLAYHPTGALASITNPLGDTTTAEADPAGLFTTVTNALGAQVTCERDAFGRPVAITDAVGGTTRMAWTVEGRLTTRMLPDGACETWTWDGEGNCLSHTTPEGHQTRYTYGHFDQIATRTDPDGAHYSFTYDTELRLTQVVAPGGLEWSYAYDPAGRLISESDFDDRTVAYHYDAASRLTARTTPLGDSITFTLDPMGRVVAKDVSGDVTHFSYDGLGRMVAARSDVSSVEVRYDVLGHPVSETVDGRTTEFRYDVLGRRSFRKTPTGAVSTFAYDQAGNRSELAIGSHLIAFAHDPRGLELARTLGGAGTPNSVTLNSSWDDAGRLRRQTLNAPGGTVRDRSYAYSVDGFPTGITDHLSGQSKTIRLDPLGRPLSVSAAGWQETYAYDQHGNQTEADWPERAADPDSRGERTYTGTRLRGAGRVTYEHDAAGRVTLRRKTRLSRKPDIWRYTYDAEDRLISCTTPDGTVWRYRYDPLGRRVSKQRLSGDGGSVVQTTHFVWDGHRLAEQTDSSSGVTLTWDHDGHRPLHQYERKPLDQGEIDSRFFAIVTDLIGAPTELVDESGQVAWHTRSTIWGTTAWNTDATAYTPLRYPGQYADAETGLYYNRYRHYDPETARYTSADPLGLAPAPNPCAYVRNPLVWADPLGLSPYAGPGGQRRASPGHVFRGGQYKDLKDPNTGRNIPGTEINHVPPASVAQHRLGYGTGPALQMDYEDHRDVYSTGSSRAARAWRTWQDELIAGGRVDEAVQMDIDDIRNRFGNKYDGAIKEMIQGLGNNPDYQALRTVPRQLY